MIYATSKTFFKVWEIEHQDNKNIIKMSSSRKNKRTDEYVYSSWTYVQFVGEAKKKSDRLNSGDRITGLEFALSWEPYEKDGKKIYAKSPRMVVFDFTVVASNGNGGNGGFEPSGEPMDDGELPF